MKKLISLLLALVLVIGLIPGVSAAQGDKYLALGDSITAGTGLKSGSSAFPEILADNNGWELENKGTDGKTSAALLEQVKSGALDNSIANAKLITITAGANDMMNLMFQLVVDAYNASYDPDITSEDIFAILKNTSDSRFFPLALITLNVINGDTTAGTPAFPDSDAFNGCVEDLSSNLKSIMSYIRKLNPDVTVIVPTQYNPFNALAGNALLAPIASNVELASEKLNEAITDAGEASGYDVADVFTAFNESDENLCNASASPVNLDYNPNAKGHAVIAELMQEIIDSKRVRYLALGDSITAGSALNEGEPSFPEILAENNGWLLTNMGADGQTSVSLLDQLSSGDLDEALAASGVITITVGGNDIMHAMYELLAEAYNEQYDPDIAPEDIIPIMTNSQDPRFFNLLMVGVELLNGFEDRPEFQEKIDEGIESMKAIMDYIRGVNAEAPVIITTQYNPYKSFDGMYEMVSKSINGAAKKLNAAIMETAKECGYLVADVYTTFYYSEEVLCNATAEPLNLDFHPNARGHEVIAQLIQDAYNGKPSCFTDVKPGDFYYEPVLWAVLNGVTTGATADTFNPGGNCLRAQVVTFLWRAAGCPEPTSTNNPFTDVKETDWFYKPVLWAVENSITNGISATEFGSYQNCNRAQVVTFLYRANGNPEFSATECPFTDVVADMWYEAPILWAVENEITNGMGDGTFGVNGVCNRAQVVTFLFRAQ